MQTVRQFGKCTLEQVSNTRGLSCGLKFLRSNGSSLSAILLGLRHAVRLVKLVGFALLTKFSFSVLGFLKLLIFFHPYPLK